MSIDNSRSSSGTFVLVLPKRSLRPKSKFKDYILCNKCEVIVDDGDLNYLYRVETAGHHFGSFVWIRKKGSRQSTSASVQILKPADKCVKWGGCWAFKRDEQCMGRNSGGFLRAIPWGQDMMWITRRLRGDPLTPKPHAPLEEAVMVIRVTALELGDLESLPRFCKGFSRFVCFVRDPRDICHIEVHCQRVGRQPDAAPPSSHWSMSKLLRTQGGLPWTIGLENSFHYCLNGQYGSAFSRKVQGWPMAKSWDWQGFELTLCNNGTRSTCAARATNTFNCLKEGWGTRVVLGS